jgi:hypothetical protein
MIPTWRLSTGGAKIVAYHEIKGASSSIVLLHAGIADSRLWEPQ